MNSFVVGLSLVFFLGLAIFLNGFLLTRRVILHQSNGTIPSTKSNDFHQIIFIVIDALRFDFIRPENCSNEENFRNQMPFVRHLIDDKSSQTVLMRLIADPPTTTLQRLKGLTTGTLPTFIDLSYNFIGYQIEEDNILSQLIKNPNVEHRRKVSLLGDDTWLALYPKIPFEHLHVYPSFDVHDLDTVDNGILLNFPSVINENDSSLIIAHFLGVDHCGHRYGPQHREMKRKLNQMDDFIRNLTLKIDSTNVSSLLIVIGDHGMTQHGDHGGDELLEIETALFLYTNVKNYFSSSSNFRTISQIDLVPTFSWFLHQLIPFSSLGAMIVDVLPVEQRFSAMKENFYQIDSYFDEISSSLTLTDRLNELRANLRTIFLFNGRQRNLTEIEQIFNEFKNEFQTICRRQWSTFDVQRISIGLVVMLISCLTFFSRIFNEIRRIWNFQYVVLLLIFFTLTFSNSFIINEGQCLYFLLQTLILTRKIDLKRKILLTTFLFLTRAFLICREEQQPHCVDPQWLMTKSFDSFNSFLPIVSTICWFGIFISNRSKSFFISFFSFVFIVAHWFDFHYALPMFYLSIFCQIVSIIFVPQRLNALIYSIVMFVVGPRFSLLIFLEFSIYSILIDQFDLSFLLLFAFFSDYFFYASGHQPVISQIRWNAAFPTGNWSIVDSLIFRAICVIFETFSGEILNVIFVRQISNRRIQLLTFEHLFLVDFIQMFVTSFSVFIFRRHLMLWKIFCPRFLFQIVALIVKSLFFILTMKIHH